MASDSVTLIKAIRKELQCPIEWESALPPNTESLITELQYHWKDITKDFEVREELRHIHYLYYDPSDEDAFLDPYINIDEPDSTLDSPEELKQELINIAGGPLDTGWIGAARKRYAEEVGVYTRLKVADDSVQSKHFLPANVPNEKRLAKSLRGGSVFYTKAQSELSHILWECLDGFNWRSIAIEGEKYLYVQYHSVAGASRGSETQFIKFDFDLSTPVVHGYPIPQSEIPEGRYPTYFDH